MSIVKPYTFVAGNKARANEVNEDFDILYQQVNANITNIANVEGEIQTLSTTKADINGSSVQRFAVADPVSSGDAVNKRTFFKQIANSIDYIGGLTIEKDSGSPNDTILVNPGAAYDSTKQVVLALDVLTSKQNTTQSASATYYVYIIGNATGSSIDILISTEASVPTLPAGYTLYRKIGSYTTDSSAHIQIISYYGQDANADKSANSMISSMMPDWSNKSSRIADTLYTATENGWVQAQAKTDNFGVNLQINGVIVAYTEAYGGQDSSGFGCLVPVSVGDTYKLENGYGSSMVSFNFISCKGDN